MNRDLLLFSLIQKGVVGKMSFAIKSIYRHTSACVNVNGRLTQPFSKMSGVRQGDSLSPTLLNLFLNSLSKMLNDSGYGVKLNGRIISHLLYADDLVLLAKNEQDLQRLHDVVGAWCVKLGLRINKE